MTMDDITALEPAVVDAGTPTPAGPSPNEHTVEPLDLIEHPKVRTKLRVYAILVALYVHYSIPALSEFQLAYKTSSSSSSS